MKRIIALLLTVLMLLGMVITVSASPDTAPLTNGENTSPGYRDPWSTSTPPQLSAPTDATVDTQKFTYNEYTGKTVDGVQNQDVFAVNREAASVLSTGGLVYDSVEHARIGAQNYDQEQTPYYQLLTGANQADWELTVLKNNADAKSAAYKDFYLPGYQTFSDTKATYTDHNYGIWKTGLQLPASWEAYGFDYSLYTNTTVPWQAEDDRSTASCPLAPVNFNPVGLYRKTFTVENGLKQSGGRIYLNFQAVESSYYVYLNGKQVGYSEDSFGAHSFDVTDYLVDGENLLAVEVHRFSDGTWFELQDMYKDGGIFRDVYLYSAPLVHIEDWFVKTDLDSTYTNATMDLTVTVRNSADVPASGYKVDVRLYDEAGNLFFNGMTLDVGNIPAASAKTSVQNIVTPNTVDTHGSATVYAPKLWTAETPNLYYLVLSLYSADGAYMGSVSQQHGFREIGFTSTQVDANGYRTTPDSEYQTITINGQRLLFKGVNRHDSDPVYGKYVSHDILEADIRIMKENNINSVATAHYPNDGYLYYLCNKYGLYIEAEPNIESHQLQAAGAAGEPYSAMCKKMILDRAENSLERLKNCTAIVMWEMENECYWSSSPDFANRAYFDLLWYFKNNDGTRPVCDSGCTLQTGTGFGGDIRGAGYNDLNFLRGEVNNPLPSLQNEYAHSMGNSTGNLKEIWDIIRSSDRMLGGFIWDFVDQGRAISLRTKTSDTVTIRDRANDLTGTVTLRSENPVRSVSDPKAMSTRSIGGTSYVTFDANESAINNVVLGSDKSFTMDVFCKPTSNDGDQPIMGRGQAAIFLKVANNPVASQQLEMYVLNDTRGYAEYYTMRAPLPANWLNNWHHVACVYNKGLMQLYVDGELLASQQNPAAHIGRKDTVDEWPFSFGAVLDSPQYFFSGELSVGRLYNRALTQDEIRQQGTSNPPITKDSDDIVFWWDAADVNVEQSVPSGVYDYYAQDYAHEGVYDSAGTYFGYGGDHGEVYHDKAFCQNGLLSPDRDLQPEMYEVKYVYQNFWFTATDEQLQNEQVDLFNENFFVDLSDYTVEWQLLRDGKPVTGASGTVDTNVLPQETRTISVPYKAKLPAAEPGVEYQLNLSVRTKTARNLIPANYEVAYEQFTLPAVSEQPSYTPASEGVTVTEKSDRYTVTGDQFSFDVSKSTGLIENYQYDGTLLMEQGPAPNYWRAPMDNDLYYDAKLQTATTGMQASKITVGKDIADVTSIDVEFSFPNAPGLKQSMSYHVESNGAVMISTSVDPRGYSLSTGRFLRVGTNLVLPQGFENVSWYGNGPVESLWDRKAFARKGVYTSTVNELFYPYMHTQDTGTLTDVSWFTVTSGASQKALAVAMRKPLETSALHFTNDQLTTANHPYELTPQNKTFVGINYRSQGTGGASCGPDVEAVYTLPTTQLYSYSFTLVPYTVGDDVTEVTRVYRKADTQQIPNQDALNLNADIDRLVVTNANQKQDVENLLAQYNALTKAGQNAVGQERYQKLTDALALTEKLAKSTSNVRVIVPDKSENHFDLDMTNHATATMFNDPAVGAVMHGSAALNAPGEKAKFDEIMTGTHPFTFEMVLRSNISNVVDAAYHPDIIISKGNECATLRFGGSTVGFYIFNKSGTQWHDTLHTTTFNTLGYTNNFVTITATYSDANNGTLSVYFNGTRICELTETGPVTPSDYDVWIGMDPDGMVRYGTGDYSSARIFGSALTADEVKLSDADKLKLKSLVAWYDFNDVTTKITDNKAALRALYETSKDKKSDDYTERSWTAFETALTGAKTVLDDENATETQIAEAKDALDAAIAGLKAAVNPGTLGADIDRLVITNANQKQAVAELLAQYDDLSAAGKQTIGEERHQKLLDAQTLIGQLEQADSKVRVIVPDKSGNGFDLDMTNHASASMFNDPTAGAVMHGNTALNAPGQKEKLDAIINGNHPFTYEMVLRSNITGLVDAGNHPDIIFSKGDSCATIRYGGATIGFYICNSDGNWKDTLFNTSLNTSQYGNQFTTVTGTYSPENGGTLTVYFNGEPICTMTNVGEVKPSDFDLWIGKDPENPGRTGSGGYSSARIFGDALTADEVKLPVEEKLKLDNIVTWYDFNDVTVKTMADKTALNAAIANAEAITDTGYCAPTWNALQAALNEAKNLGADAAQDVIDAKTAALNTAITNLKTHDFTGDYQSDAEGHWHVCTTEGCTVTDTKQAHTPDREAPTETDAKKCAVCNYTIEVELGHQHVNHLTSVAEKTATCKETGNIAHWLCSCNKLFADENAETELTAADVVMEIDPTNHVGGTEIRDARAATETSEGYTGDTYCLSCKAKIASGTVIPKLTPAPTPVTPVTPSEPASNPFNPNAGSSTSKFPFTDVPSDSWYYSSVKAAWENDLIDGVTVNEFKPNATLTVAQTIKLAAALHQLDRTGEVSLKNGGANWYDSYVNYAVTNGIIEQDYANYTKAQMNAPVTRGEFVHIFHGAEEAYKAINTVADNAIPDVKTTDKFAPEIYEFYRAGILTGSDVKGTFHSTSTIKRSEAAAILLRMFEASARKSITLN